MSHTLTLKKKPAPPAAAPAPKARAASAPASAKTSKPAQRATSFQSAQPSKAGTVPPRTNRSAPVRRAPAAVRSPVPEPEGERLSKRVAQLLDCSRREAECYIENGAVQVDGQMVQIVGQRVLAHQQIAIAPGARPEPVPPVTLLVHKPAGWAFADGARPVRGAQGNAWELLTPERWSQGDAPAPLKLLLKHFQGQQPLLVLPVAASGLCVLSQEPRTIRKLTDDALYLEQEVIAQVQGRAGMDPEGLQRLCDGTAIAGKRLPRIKVSWQNEERLRFALQGIFAHEVQAMCHGVGLQLVGLKRLRIGRIPLGALPEGHWRYLQPWERF